MVYIYIFDVSSCLKNNKDFLERFRPLQPLILRANRFSRSKDNGIRKITLKLAILHRWVKCVSTSITHQVSFYHWNQSRIQFHCTSWSDAPRDSGIVRCLPYRKPWMTRLDLQASRNIENMEIIDRRALVDYELLGKVKAITKYFPQINKEMKSFSLSKCSMLNPIVGTEMCFRSSLFLKKCTIVDFPELFRPMIRMLICLGFLSLFKIFINNFSNTIFAFSRFSDQVRALECLFSDRWKFLVLWWKY